MDKKELQQRLDLAKQKLNDLTKQVPVKNAQINAFGKEAQIPTSSSFDVKNAEREKQKFKLEKSNARDKVRVQLKDLNDEIEKTKEEIKVLQNQIINPDAEEQQGTQPTEFNESKKQTKMARLTKEEILRLLESQEPARMSKRELIESISNQLLREDMNDDLKDKIDSGNNDYAQHLDADTVRRMANDIMDDVKANLTAKMGGRGRVDFEGAQRTLAHGLMNVLPKEHRHKAELERLAVQLVREEYDIPEDAVDFDARIMGQEPIHKTNLKMRKGNKRPPQGKSEEELKPNVTKRRLMNAMMHGAARKGQYMYHMAQDQLNNIDPSLAQDYSKIMAGNDFMYWAMDDNTIAQESEHGTHAGQVRVDLSGEKPKIIAQGMTFPFLLHELTKGVLELMSLHGLDADKETRDYVLDKTDNLESEPWDIRLGPKIWEKFMEALDADDLPYKSHIFNKISTLPPAEFNQLIQGLLNDSEEARGEVRGYADDIRRELGEEEVEKSFSQYRDEDKGEDGDTAEGDEDHGDPELERLLGKKGDEPTEEEDYDDPENWSKRELESEIDAALDRSDFNTVRMLTDILNRKY